jgi:ADP-L-glycero-D-manno-heptose 6-epimerase
MLLVTGGAGFIGADVISALNAQGIDDIIAVDDLMYGQKCLNLVGKKFADYRDFRELIKKPVELLRLPHLTGIIHLGAISNTQFPNGRILMERNYTFSKRMLELAIHHGCPMVYASSASVYGDGKTGFQEHPENERPKSPYAFSKWAFDQHVRRELASGRLEIPVTGLRYFNVYGPGEAHKGNMASFAYKCFMAMQHKRDIEVFEGSRDITRDFIHISDAADITAFFLNAKTSGIFNVGTGTATSFLDVAEMAAEAYGGPENTVNIRMVPFIESMRKGYQWHTQADITRLRAAGWTRPFVGVEAGIKDYWQRMKERNER